MSRLTKCIKEAIVENAVEKAGIPDMLSAIVARRATWAENVRVKALGGIAEVIRINKVNEAITELISSLPKGVVQSTNPLRVDYDMRLNVAGSSFTAYFHGATGYDGDRVYKLAPANYTLLATDPLADEFQAICKAEDKVREKQRAIVKNVNAVLNSVTTVKKLLAVWPEAEVLLPDGEAPVVAGLPAVQIAELNMFIGLK